VDVSGDLVDNDTTSVVGTVDATLTGTSWSGGNWQADVEGSTTTGMALGGAAAGTYDSESGTFAGAGAGAWERGE